MRRLIRRWYWRLTHRRRERPGDDTCRGRIGQCVAVLDRSWLKATDRWALQNHRDHAIHVMRATARELLRELGG